MKKYEIGENVKKELHAALSVLFFENNKKELDSDILYSSSPDSTNFLSEEFHLKCDDKGSLVFIFFFDKFIMGCFTVLGIMKDIPYTHDKNCGYFSIIESKVTISEFQKDYVNNLTNGFSFGENGEDFEFIFLENSDYRLRGNILQKINPEKSSFFFSSNNIQLSKIIVYQNLIS